MRKDIIITSIFNPTEAIEKFSKLDGYNLIVVGDKKTPSNWEYENTVFLSIEDQENQGFELGKVLPYNHYCRKMIGYLYSIKNGSEIIIDTDDDNIPNEDWQFPSFEGEFNTYLGGDKYVNIYKYFTEMNIWPRGLPLENILTTKEQFDNYSPAKIIGKIGVWQGLADEDPDVDAIYRLTIDKLCVFNKREPIVLAKGSLCPFNSQNTSIIKELFPLLYLPTYVTFRFTDILRGYIAQIIMGEFGYYLGFTEATVIQKRNPHNYLNDFVSEIPMYANMDKVVNLLYTVVSAQYTITENLLNAYNILLDNEIVEERELVTLRAWLKDLEVLGIN